MLCPFDYLNKLNIDKKRIINQSIKAHAFGGFWLDVKGAIDIECFVDGHKKKIKFVIIRNRNIKPLLGRLTCEKIKLITY